LKNSYQFLSLDGRGLRWGWERWGWGCNPPPSNSLPPGEGEL